MGSGASASTKEELTGASIADIKKALQSASPEEREKLLKAVTQFQAEPPRPSWLPSTGPGNLNLSPDLWGMTLQQWAAFILACKLTPQWQQCSDSTNRKEAGFVNLYQIVTDFVKPWTRGMGNGIALLLNNEAPVQAKAMLSHAWGAGILETLTALLSRASGLGMSLETAVWFCAFACYQPGDEEGDCGPGVAAQLAMDPFGVMIRSNPPYGMIVLHTTNAELYSRLWCVYEVQEALTAKIPVLGCMSAQVVKRFGDYIMTDQRAKTDFAVDTEKADCFSEDDSKMIRALIIKGGGYEQINGTIEGFRKSVMGPIYWNICGFDTYVADGKVLDKEGHLGVLDLFAALIRLSAEWISLMCFVKMSGAISEDILKEAKTVLGALQTKIQVMPTDNKIGARFMIQSQKAKSEVPKVDDEVALQEALLGKTDFMFPLGLLEISCGGDMTQRLLDKIQIWEGEDEDIGKLGQEDLVKKAFSDIDLDGDGKISLDEMLNVFKNVNTRDGKPVQEELVRMLYKVADKNGDGNVDFDRFVEWLFNTSLLPSTASTGKKLSELPLICSACTKL